MLGNMTIRHVVRRLRTERGLTQLQLATAAGITPSAVAAIEYGVNTNPRMITLLGLAHALSVTPNDLMIEDSKAGPLPKRYRHKKRRRD